MMDAARITKLDQDDPLAAKREEFFLPEGIIYLDGNSLGALPRSVPERLKRTIEKDWGSSLIRGWNEAGWIDLPRCVGDKIARLIGAPMGSVIAADSTTLNLAKALSAAISLEPKRKIILSDSGNFPTDLYVAQMLCASLGRGHELRIVAPDDVEGAIDESIAILMLTEVDYRTGRRHDVMRLSRHALSAGVITIWDLAHSAGAMPVDLTEANADFAVGCGYKYLNGGPGAPAFIYMRPDHAEHCMPFLAGWMGHAAPFAFELGYRPAAGIDRMAVGTPAILSLTALDTALDVWDGVDINIVRAKSVALCELFIAEVERLCEGYGLRLAGPRESASRGSQVSFHCADGYAVMQALIAQGVIGDFRAPDIIRFGMTPLYLRYQDVADAAAVIARVLREGLWRNPVFTKRSKVT